MHVLASFNYTDSMPAVVMGAIFCVAIAASLIYSGRPWLAALLGAMSWSCIGYMVGLAGRGDMRSIAATVYAMLGFPAGGLIAGLGAGLRVLIRERNVRRAACDRHES